ncbi:MAG: hypothetical protein HSCHL_0865 [Hydrogenibacillus schlegelii]|uniref:Uncharacterized protein n=1 Tax=Hydrogenibacillus schlegelii TaxID=1484 RepID=A0A2T5GCU4_HYDSH|nr:hypothetical protein [Hydrogenibacillus schlegelii]PTQ54011.1 MAG: hypothetical protein HSCHL_0865 [Hydrogenibacillus schlegelii]
MPDGYAWLSLAVWWGLWRSGVVDGRAGGWFLAAAFPLVLDLTGLSGLNGAASALLVLGALRLAPDVWRAPFATVGRTLLAAGLGMALLVALVESPALRIVPEPALPWAALALVVAALSDSEAEAWALATLAWAALALAVSALRAAFPQTVDLPALPPGDRGIGALFAVVWAAVAWRAAFSAARSAVHRFGGLRRRTARDAGGWWADGVFGAAEDGVGASDGFSGASEGLSGAAPRLRR